MQRRIVQRAIRITVTAVFAVVPAIAFAQTSWTDADKPALTSSEAPKISVVENLRVTATVRGIDKGARTVTLRYPNGDEETVKAGNEVRNFDQIQVGDTVNAEYDRLTNIFTRPPLSGTSATEGSTFDRANKGEKPRATAVQTTEITAVVETIDPNARSVTLRGPQGRTRTVRVPPDVGGLENVKAGDEVVVRQTEAMAISVVK